MDFTDLEDLSAMVAVAATLLPHQFPTWSDGYDKHMAALVALWRHLRADIADHRIGALAIDLEVRAMMAAFNTGNAEEARRCAMRLDDPLRDAIERRAARRPSTAKSARRFQPSMVARQHVRR